MEQFLAQVITWIWGPPLLILVVGCGLFLTFALKGVQFRYLGYALKQVFTPQPTGEKGDISPFEALMTSLAGAIGTGNIVGVTTALTIGGMGSLFWMWVTAFLGMAIKYAESLLAVKYRQEDKNGEMCGGPMQYMEHGLGWRWMALLFAFFGALAAIGTGNLVQVNAIAESVAALFPVNPWIVGTVLAAMTGAVLIGGVKSIGRVAGVLVPFMALLYLVGGLTILLINFDKIPGAFALIIQSAFSPQAAVGGFAGASVLMAIRMGVSRSVFSNEAGLGISSIAAAAAMTKSPAKQALITMTGALISTVIVCTITGLVIAVTGTHGLTGSDGTLITGATLAIHAFNSSIPGGGVLVSIGLILFAYSTVIAWAYYGEKCFEYLFGEKAVPVYRVLFTLIIIPGAATKMAIAWHIADIMNGLMAIPNLIALILLCPVIQEETQSFLREEATSMELEAG